MIVLLIDTLKKTFKNKHFYILLIISFLIMFINRAIVLNSSIMVEYGYPIIIINTIVFYLLYATFSVLYIFTLLKEEFSLNISSVTLFAQIFIHLLKIALISFVVVGIAVAIESIVLSESDIPSLQQMQGYLIIQVVGFIIYGLINVFGLASVLINQSSKNSIRNAFSLMKRKSFLAATIMIVILPAVYIPAAYIIASYDSNIFLVILNYFVNVFYRIYLPFLAVYGGRIVFYQEKGLSFDG